MRKFLWSLVVVVLALGCSTQKSKSDQSGFSEFYHNTTSKFNGYFNANEIMEESIAQLNAQQQDNYNALLPIYEYRAAPNPEAVAANLDEAIKKVSIVATLHEYSDWVDDCYLLIGKAEYLKQDFESAENAFEFFLDEFERDGKRSGAASAKKKKSKKNNSASRKANDKKRKNEEKARQKRAKEAEKARKKYNKAVRKNKKLSEKGKATKALPDAPGGSGSNVASKRNTTRATEPPPEQKEEPKKDPQAEKENPGGVKHRPAYQEVQLWLAKTYIERENYPRAEYHINDLLGYPYLQEEVRVEIPAVQAYYAITRKNYKGAIPHLEQAIEVTKDRAARARYAYILGQIYDLEDEASGKSFEYYKMAHDFKPNYEMMFNSELSMARTAYLSGENSLDASIAILDKMLKDEKNEEYQDKLYYTYARIDLFRGDKDAAIDHLVQSVQAGGSNPAQQTESNYLLATLYFEKNMYREAKAAYDAALATMSKDDERYEMTSILAANLTDIANHLATIELQDSLLKISAMSEDEKLALAEKIYETQKAGYNNSKQGMADGDLNGKGKGKGDKTTLASAQLQGMPQARPVINTGQSSFFAFDDKAIRRGERDFDRVWGDRPLADNWRISSKLEATGTFNDEELPDPFEEDELDEEDMAKILTGVPSTPEEIAAAHNAIQNAKLQLGYLYREKLDDPALSVDILEEVVRDYPEGQSIMEVYYQLYVSYTALGNTAKANYYKEQIITQFPGTKYAMALSDPDYINKQLSEEQMLQQHYQDVYNTVENGEYARAKQMMQEGKAQFGTQHAYQGKLAILEAMCIGNEQGKEAYVNALKDVVANFPNSEAETKARDMLLLLGEYKSNKLNLQTSSSSSGPAFRPQPNAVHYILIKMNNFEEINIKDAKISVSNYNRKYHKLDRLKITSLVFDPKSGESVILVRSYKNAEEAMKYYNNIAKHPDEFLPTNIQYEVYPVSQFNYREVIKQRSLDQYQVFFEETYR